MTRRQLLELISEKTEMYLEEKQLDRVIKRTGIILTKREKPGRKRLK
jgi:hypothetical protein